MAREPIRLDDLYEAMKRDMEVLRPYRESRVELIKEVAGGNYGHKPSNAPDDERKKPVNLSSLFVRTMSAYLLGNEPQAMWKSEERRLWPICQTGERWMNKQVRKMHFTETANRVIMDAFFQLGILRVALTTPAESRYAGGGVGKMKACHIDFEDFGFDTRARVYSECDYVWHRYRALYDDVRKSTVFKAKARKALQPMHAQELNEGGDERVLTVSRGGMDGDEYHKYVELIECYFPRQKRVVTFDAHEPDELLLDQDWIGPECGPYILMQFQLIAGQLMPKGVLMDLVDLDRSVNVMWKKSDYQASIQKKLNLFRDADEAKRLKMAEDGSWEAADHSAVESKSFNGPDQMVGIWTKVSIDQFMEQAGGLRTLAGLGAQADTATQEKLLAANASIAVHAMSKDVAAFLRQAFYAMGWFYWHSPDDEFKTVKQAPGVPWATTNAVVRPVDRIETPYEDTDIDFNPYSTTFQTPQQTFAVIDQTFKETLIPVLPMLGQPGVAGLIEKYIKMKAKYHNVPDLLELLDELVGADSPQAEQEEEGMPNETTRTYERISKPGMTDKGNRQMIDQAMAKAGGEGTGAYASAMGH